MIILHSKSNRPLPNREGGGRVFFLLSFIAIFTFLSCTESFEDRCRREAREYTAKQCPRLLSEYIIMDSMVYVDEPKGFTYYNTVSGELDNDSLLTPEALADFKDDLLQNIRQDVNLKRYKERGFTFTYHYTSASTGKVFTEAALGPEDYR